jgi:hypothetical protein
MYPYLWSLEMKTPVKPSNQGCLVAVFLTLLLSSCVIPYQIKEKEADSLPPSECAKNHTRAWSLRWGLVDKTWVRYPGLDVQKALDHATMSLRNTGYRIVSMDPSTGEILAEKASVLPQPVSYSLEVRIEKDDQALTLHFRSKVAEEASVSLMPCVFFAEFERLMAQPSVPVPHREKTVTLSTLPERPRKAPDAPPSPAATLPEPSPSLPPPSPSPPTAETPALPQRVTEVVWSVVNLRDGPGMNHRVIGQATKGTALVVFEEKRGWLRVQIGGGKDVWVSKSATSEGSSRSTPSTPTRPTIPPQASSSSQPSSPSSPQPALTSPPPAQRPISKKVIRPM